MLLPKMSNTRTQAKSGNAVTRLLQKAMQSSAKASDVTPKAERAKKPSVKQMIEEFLAEYTAFMSLFNKSFENEFGCTIVGVEKSTNLFSLDPHYLALSNVRLRKESIPANMFSMSLGNALVGDDSEYALPFIGEHNTGYANIAQGSVSHILRTAKDTPVYPYVHNVITSPITPANFNRELISSHKHVNTYMRVRASHSSCDTSDFDNHVWNTKIHLVSHPILINTAALEQISGIEYANSDTKSLDVLFYTRSITLLVKSKQQLSPVEDHAGFDMVLPLIDTVAFKSAQPLSTLKFCEEMSPSDYANCGLTMKYYYENTTDMGVSEGEDDDDDYGYGDDGKVNNDVKPNVTEPPITP